MANDYILVEYDDVKRPVTDYPRQLATQLAKLWGIQPGMRLLDVASGRAEVAAAFVDMGVHVVCLDSAESGKDYARRAGAEFVYHQVAQSTLLPFHAGAFDVVYSKSFIEHIRFPVEFLTDVARILRPGGTALTLTPDWQANHKIFYDDVTHVSPFTTVTMRQAIELSGLRCVDSYTFRQLPITWRYPWVNFLSATIAPFTSARSRNKFLRWSRELMVCGVGRRN